MILVRYKWISKKRYRNWSYKIVGRWKCI